MKKSAENESLFVNRLWQYQSERFPVFVHGLSIAPLAFASLAVSRALRGEPTFVPLLPLLGSIVCVVLAFFILRVCDEFKDNADDTLYRPDRPVPRGLISLRELFWCAVISCMIQAALTFAINPAALPYLGLVWLYTYLMRREFFIPDQIKKHPIAYMVSHMVIMPLITLYATSMDWAAHTRTPVPQLGAFLLLSFFGGMIIEVGRKIRIPADEQNGVQTYSSLFGPRRAALLWLGILFTSAVFASMVANNHAPGSAMVILLTLCLCTASPALIYILNPHSTKGTIIELFSGLWILLMYTLIGFLASGLFRQLPGLSL